MRRIDDQPMKTVAAGPDVSTADLEAALCITPLFYDAVLQPARWEDALKAICEWFTPACAATAHFNGRDLIAEGGTRIPHFLMYSYGLTKEAKADYLAYGKYGPDVDPRARAYFPRYVNRPVTCRQLVTAEEWHNSPTYLDLFKPHGLDFNLTVTILSEDFGTLFGLGVYRGPEDPPFTQSDVDRLQLLIPHLRRAAEVYSRLVSSELKSRQLENAFGDLALATIFTDTAGQILFANQSATDLLDRDDGLCRIQDSVAHHDPKISEELGRAIRVVSAGATLGDAGTVHHLALPRSEHDTPLLATVCSLAASSSDAGPWLTSELRVAIFLTDPQKSYETTTEHLQRIFGLTKAEAEIARDVASGFTLKEIADKTDRALHTVRKHLQRTMEKTGTRRQAELVRHILASGIPLAN